jgi:acyl-CoA reductase-like NAD-dependent aldehyde dehydrogenase
MSDRSITLRNPADDSVIQEVSLATAHDVDQAVARAHAVLPAWRDMAPNDRAKLMRQFADTVAAHAQELAELDTRNMGMPIGSSLWCANTAAEVIY